MGNRITSITGNRNRSTVTLRQKNNVKKFLMESMKYYSVYPISRKICTKFFLMRAYVRWNVTIDEVAIVPRPKWFGLETFGSMLAKSLSELAPLLGAVIVSIGLVFGRAPVDSGLYAGLSIPRTSQAPSKDVSAVTESVFAVHNFRKTASRVGNPCKVSSFCGACSANKRPQRIKLTYQSAKKGD